MTAKLHAVLVCDSRLTMPLCKPHDRQAFVGSTKWVNDTRTEAATHGWSTAVMEGGKRRGSKKRDFCPACGGAMIDERIRGSETR